MGALLNYMRERGTAREWLADGIGGAGLIAFFCAAFMALTAVAPPHPVSHRNIEREAQWQ